MGHRLARDNMVHGTNSDFTWRKPRMEYICRYLYIYSKYILLLPAQPLPEV